MEVMCIIYREEEGEGGERLALGCHFCYLLFTPYLFLIYFLFFSHFSYLSHKAFENERRLPITGFGPGNLFVHPHFSDAPGTLVSRCPMGGIKGSWLASLSAS